MTKNLYEMSRFMLRSQGISEEEIDKVVKKPINEENSLKVLEKALKEDPEFRAFAEANF